MIRTFLKNEKYLYTFAIYFSLSITIFFIDSYKTRIDIVDERMKDTINIAKHIEQDFLRLKNDLQTCQKLIQNKRTSNCSEIFSHILNNDDYQPHEKIQSFLFRINQNNQTFVYKIISTYFDSVLNSLSLGEDDFISITTINNVLLTRKPPLFHMLNKKIPEPDQLIQFIKSNKKILSIEFHSKLLDKKYLTTMINVESQFIIKVSISKKHALSSWLSRTFFHFAIFLLSNFLLLTVLVYFFRLSTKYEKKEKEILYLNRLTSLSDISMSIAHEFNNPLAVISGHIQSIERKLSQIEDTSLKDSITKSTFKIHESIKRMLKIIQSMKSYSKDSFNSPVEKINLRHLIEKVYLMYKNKIPDTRFELICNKDIFVECIPGQLEQVFINLIDNSLAALKETDKRWIQFQIDDLGFEIQIKITDNGKGIPGHLQDKIMEPFFTTKDPNAGVGLGLSISQGIINNHHGKLKIDTSSNYTCFIITLPKHFDFDEAISVHQNWKKRLLKYSLTPDGSLKAEEIRADNKCELGCWIYGKGNIYSDIEEFNHLKRVHTHFHIVASEMIEKINSRKLSQKELDQLFNEEFDKSSQKIIEIIQQIKRKIAQRE